MKINLNKTVIFSSFYILGIVGFLTGTTAHIAGLLVVLTIIGLIKNQISCKSALIYCLMFILALSNCHFRIKNYDDLSKYLPSKGILTGTVISIPTTNNNDKTKFYLKVDSGVLDGSNIVTSFSSQTFEPQSPIFSRYHPKVQSINAKTIVTLHGEQKNFSKIKIGDKVELKGKLRNPIKAKNPSQFDYANYLKNHNTFSTFYVEDGNWRITSKPTTLSGKFLQKLNDTRIKILNTQKKYIKSPNIEVLGGIVFGDDAINPPDYIKNSFINSGLLHILAASGMNVSIIFGLWFFIGSKLKINRRFVITAGAMLVAFYTLMTGMGPSVLRAAIMIEFIIFGKLIDRSTNSISLIFIAAFLMLVYDPRMITDVGFQLSFIITFALIFYCQPVIGKIQNKITETIAGAIFIPFVAQLWAAPIQMFYFNTFTTYSILANMAIAPFIVIISFMGFLCSILAMIPISIFSDKICMIFAIAINPIVTILIKISNFFSALPHSLFTTIHPNIWQIVLYYTIMVFIGFVLRNKQKNKNLIISIVVLCLCFTISLIKLPDQKLEIIVFDVGNADSFLIKTPNKKYIMIDTAHGLLPNSKNKFSQADAIMGKYLKDHGIKTFETLVLTHFDSDHSGGAVDIMQSVDVKKLVINKKQDDSKTTRYILKYIEENNINTIKASNNEIIYEEPELKLITFTPNLIVNQNDNDNSTVTLLSYKDFDVLFMADAGNNSFKAIQKDLHKDNIEILKSGHHGAKNTVTKEMLNKINPDSAIISTGYNTYGHPTKETLRTLTKNNVKIYRTDTDNAIKITSNGITYNIYRYNTSSHRFIKDREKQCK